MSGMSSANTIASPALKCQSMWLKHTHEHYPLSLNRRHKGEAEYPGTARLNSPVQDPRPGVIRLEPDGDEIADVADGDHVALGRVDIVVRRIRRAAQHGECMLISSASACQIIRSEGGCTHPMQMERMRSPNRTDELRPRHLYHLVLRYRVHAPLWHELRRVCAVQNL